MLHNLGMAIEVAGELLIAYTVLRVHHRVLSEHKIDKKVIREMRTEQFLGISGVVGIFVGFIFQLFF